MTPDKLSSLFLYDRPEITVESFKKIIVYKLIFMIGRDPGDATERDWLNALMLAARDLRMEGWIFTGRQEKEEQSRRVYYLSMEFLIGRTLSNALVSEGLYDFAKEAMAELGMDLETVIEKEVDPGLGNGGLGRLAACFMDSIATLALPAMGYGIRYEYGMFRQKIENGMQIERPDSWLEKGTPWEIINPSKHYYVRVGGQIHFEASKCIWTANRSITALAYDYIIPGHGTNAASTLRLWSAHAGDVFDLENFNKGDYSGSMGERSLAETVSRVLYPNDSTENGRQLRLIQEYFLVSASLQDIIYQHKAEYGTVENLAEKTAIHLNDTHPTLAIPELMRILMDDEGYGWDKAWGMVSKIFSYTNHTLMGEALETWSVDMMSRLLPRHMHIIFEINEHFLNYVRRNVSDEGDFIRRISLIDESGERKVRMAWLCVVGSHKVNGVAAIHSKLMVNSIFSDFARIFPDRFTNVTNGITPRRWVGVANRPLAALFDRYIGNGWRRDLSQIEKLKPLAGDAEFRQALRGIKAANKARLAGYIEKNLGIEVDPNALFDVQIKRIHEYKRQILNLLHIVARYNRILAEPEKDWVPRVFVLAGKAASSYVTAKETIHLINDVAGIINNDERLKGRLKVVFIPNYSVSLAELIIPAADISEQISLAGTEASGTGNMKFALNGALTLGTLDGANVEILEHVGGENIFIFGNTVEEVETLRRYGYRPLDYYQRDPELRQVIDQFNSGALTNGSISGYQELVQSMEFRDYYQAFADFRSYIDTQDRVDEKYRDQEAWLTSVIANITNMGYFSSDRTIREYAEKIWHVKPLNTDAETKAHPETR